MAVAWRRKANGIGAVKLAPTAPGRNGLGRIGKGQRDQAGLSQTLDVPADHAEMVRAHEPSRGNARFERQPGQQFDGEIDGGKDEAMLHIDHHRAKPQLRRRKG